jgi:hypothetical protein
MTKSLGPAMLWVQRNLDETLSLEPVRSLLDALPRETHRAGDLRYVCGSVLDDAEHLPAGTGEAHRRS